MSYKCPMHPEASVTLIYGSQSIPYSECTICGRSGYSEIANAQIIHAIRPPWHDYPDRNADNYALHVKEAIKT